jgi:ABC-type antimicrobial peptide transport system permease subunit
VGAVLGSAFGRIFFKTPVAIVPQWSGVAVWLGVVVVVSTIACAWPAVRATRVSARTALSYE